MKKRRHIMIRLLAAVLALALFPFAATAYGENTLESAPEVVLQEAPADETQSAQETGPLWSGMDEPVTADSFWSAYANIPERYGVDYKWLEESGYQDEFYIDPYLTLEEYRARSELIGEDVYEAIDLAACVEKRTSAGGTCRASVEAQIAYVKEVLNL